MFCFLSSVICNNVFAFSAKDWARVQQYPEHHAKGEDWDLSGVDLSGSIIRNVDLSGANLKGANCSNSKVYNVNLTNAYLNQAVFTGAELQHYPQ